MDAAAEEAGCIARLRRHRRVEQRSAEWQSLRGTLLTASDVAAALGIKPYASYAGDPRQDLVRRKAEQAIGINSFTGNAATAWGQQHEPVAIRMYSERTGQRVEEFGLIVHPEHRWLGGSPDGVTHTGRLLEIKCPVSRKIGDGAVPHHYFPQLQICMEVCGLDTADFVQYRPQEITWPFPEEFVVTEVPRDRSWFAEALPALLGAYREIQAAREAALAAGTVPWLENKPAPRARARRQAVCRIVDDLYGVFQPPPAERAHERPAECRFERPAECRFKRPAEREPERPAECRFRPRAPGPPQGAAPATAGGPEGGRPPPAAGSPG